MTSSTASSSSSSSSSSSTTFKSKKSNCGQINGKVSQQLIDYASSSSSNSLRSSLDKYFCSIVSPYAPNNNEGSNRRNMIVDEPFIYSYIVTGDFNLSTLKLPFSHVENGDVWCNNDDEDDDSGPLAIMGAALVYFALFFMPIVSLFLMAFIVYLCLVVWFEYKLKSNIIKTILII